MHMIKKLTSFLFKEEEIILDESEHEVEAISIKPLEPLKPLEQRPLQKSASLVLEEIEAEKALTQQSEDFKVEAEKPVVKKSMMIDLEETPQETPLRRTETVQSTTEYRRRNIISPIYGGPDKGSTKTNVEPITAQRTKMRTDVISPIYGSYQKMEKEEGFIDMDLDLKDMLQEEIVEEDIQTSLFDYFEGTEFDE